MSLPWLLPYFSVIFASLSLAATEKKSHKNDRGFPRKIPHEFMRLARVVFSFALGNLHTECVSLRGLEV